MSETLESGSACGAPNFLHPPWLLTAIPRSRMSGFVNSQDIQKFCALNILKSHLYPLHPLVRQRFWVCDVAPGHGGSRGRRSFGRRRSGMALEVGHRLLNLMRFVVLHPRALINLQTWSLGLALALECGHHSDIFGFAIDVDHEGDFHFAGCQRRDFGGFVWKQSSWLECEVEIHNFDDWSCMWLP